MFFTPSESRSAVNIHWAWNNIKLYNILCLVLVRISVLWHKQVSGSTVEIFNMSVWCSVSYAFSTGTHLGVIQHEGKQKDKKKMPLDCCPRIDRGCGPLKAQELYQGCSTNLCGLRDTAEAEAGSCCTIMDRQMRQEVWDSWLNTPCGTHTKLSLT